MVALHDLVSSAEEQEGTSSVSALGLTRLETLVADESTLLVSDKTTDRHTSESTRRDLSVDFGRGNELGQDRLAEVEELEQRGLPLESAKVQEESSRGVGNLADVYVLLHSTEQVLLILESR